MVARIYKPSKTAMQSGRGKNKDWVLEYAPDTQREVEPLMGWTGSIDMDAQVRMAFGTKEEAVAYAKASGIAFAIFEPPPGSTIKKSYAENFKFGRPGSWTH